MSEEATALDLVLSGDPALYAIVRLSLAVSLGATLLAALIWRAAGRAYRIDSLSRATGRGGRAQCTDGAAAGGGGACDLSAVVAFRPAGLSSGCCSRVPAMVITQTMLVLPIIAALTRQTMEDLWLEYRDELAAMGVRPMRRAARCCGMRAFRW